MKRRTTPVKEAARKLHRTTECALIGRHFFTRDYVLGIFPVGRPYCMWCGKTTDETN